MCSLPGQIINSVLLKGHFEDVGPILKLLQHLLKTHVQMKDDADSYSHALRHLKHVLVLGQSGDLGKIRASTCTMTGIIFIMFTIFGQCVTMLTFANFEVNKV